MPPRYMKENIAPLAIIGGVVDPEGAKLVTQAKPRAVEHGGILHVIRSSSTNLLGSKLKDGRQIMLDGMLMHTPCVLRSLRYCQ
jgi:hypothetical protein